MNDVAMISVIVETMMKNGWKYNVNSDSFKIEDVTLSGHITFIYWRFAQENQRTTLSITELLFRPDAMRVAYGTDMVCDVCGGDKMDKILGFTQALKIIARQWCNKCKEYHRKLPRFIHIASKAIKLSLSGEDYIKYLYDNLPKKHLTDKKKS